MRTDRNISYGYRAGGHNNRPVYPDDIQMEHPRARKGCLPVIIVLSALIIAGILASAFLFIPWWIGSQIENYKPFNSRALVGTITNANTEQSNVSQLILAMPVDGGTLITSSPYILRCEEWRLHADSITTPSWINTQTHSWYQLTYIEGKQCRDQHGKPWAYMNIPIVGSDDGFGASVRKGEGWGIIVNAKEITSNFVPVDGKSYQVIVTSTALLLIASH